MKILCASLIGTALIAGYGMLPAGDSQAVAQTQSAALQPGETATERYLCDRRETVVGELSSEFQEKPVAVGLQGNGTLLELFASKETGSWTVLITLPSGVTCLTLVGDSFEMLPPQPDGPRV